MRARTLLGVLATSLLLAGEARATEIDFHSDRADIENSDNCAVHVNRNAVRIFVWSTLGDQVSLKTDSTSEPFTSSIEIDTVAGANAFFKPVLKIGGALVGSGQTLDFVSFSTFAGIITVTQPGFGVPVGSPITATVQFGDFVNAPDGTLCTNTTGSLVAPPGFATPPPIPEPGTLSLLSLGALGLLTRRRIR